MNTQFITRAVGRHKAKALIGTGTGLSAAAIVFLYATFPTKSDVQQVRDSQRTIWQRMADQKTDQDKEINELKIRVAVLEREKQNLK